VTLTRSLSNSEKQNIPVYQTTEDLIAKFQQKKYRASRSYCTKTTYGVAIKRFSEFVTLQYSLDLGQLLPKIKDKTLDAIDVLDEFYTYLSEHKNEKTGRPYNPSTITHYLITTKEFLNTEGCKIYNEDVRQRFKLPRARQAYEQGLTKELINRVLRFANPKLATIILLACSGGMRVAEIAQLRVCDVIFTTTPTTLTIRAQTTKTRQTRITHISSEATGALQDYLARKERQNTDYLFLLQLKDRIKHVKESMQNSSTKFYHNREKRRLDLLESHLSLDPEELYNKSVRATIHNLELQLLKVISKAPSLNMKSEYGRNVIHFHAFRAWFKTQVTDAHQSDFAEALMGHKSLKLTYYRQNEKARARIYLDIEHALTISDTEKVDNDYSELQKDNLELRGIVDGLSKQLRSLEKRISNNSLSQV